MRKCPPRQLNIKMFTENMFSHEFCFKWQKSGSYCGIVKKNSNLKKWSNMKELRIFYEKSRYQEQRPFEENKTVMKKKL